MILAFAENYTFVTQDTIQSFHLNNVQAKIQPLMIYFKKNGKLQHKSLACISDYIQCISDYMQHDVFSVYTF